MSTKNARTLSIRLDASETENLAKFEQATGIDGVSLGRNALRACLAYFNKGGTITFPLVLNPKAATEIPDRFREEPTPYPNPKTESPQKRKEA
jgi:hypothetical protein